DRIRAAPPAEHPVDNSTDTVRGFSFGEPIGAPGWPGRFAWKAQVPILPATVLQSRQEIVLKLGPEVSPLADLVKTTQSWIDEFEELQKAHPHEWAFSLDKHWSKALRNSRPS
ncbi:MAG: hypothetical protein OXQ92_12555, partial [Boseongicola sp.]|nr:hypothetical protein [Boseongicola sp.]